MRKVIYAPFQTTMFCFAVAVFSAIAAHADNSADVTQPIIPSKLVEDDRGILWAERGNDNRHPGALAAALSQRPPYFVIYVSTTDEYKTRAIDHALRLRDWFQKQPHMPKKIDVVASLSPTHTYYKFQISGLFYKHNEIAPDGLMGPQDTYEVLKDVIIDYRACMALREQGEFEFMAVREVDVFRNQH